MDHEELATMIGEVRDDVKAVNKKMDSFIERCTRNSVDIIWIKGGGAIGLLIILAVAAYLTGVKGA